MAVRERSEHHPSGTDHVGGIALPHGRAFAFVPLVPWRDDRLRCLIRFSRFSRFSLFSLFRVRQTTCLRKVDLTSFYVI